jgi:hypothetical protein
MVLFFLDVEVRRLYRVFQENDGGVYHAHLQLAVDDAQNFPCRDSFVHHGTSVATKYAHVMEPLHGRFEHLQIKRCLARQPVCFYNVLRSFLRSF